jgi:type I restriction enzyme S subunit
MHTCSKVEEGFIYWWLIAHRNQLIQMGYGGGQPNISQEKIARIRFFAPEPTEQTAIVTYLDTQTVKIDGLIAHVQQEIELLKELRSATITDAVLGRIDLRDYTKKNKQDKASELQPAL